MHCPTLRSPPGRSVPPHRARTHRARHRGRSTTSSSDLPRHACGAGRVESGARTRRSEAGRRGGRRSSEDIDRARDRRFGAAVSRGSRARPRTTRPGGRTNPWPHADEGRASYSSARWSARSWARASRARALGFHPTTAETSAFTARCRTDGAPVRAPGERDVVQNCASGGAMRPRDARAAGVG